MTYLKLDIDGPLPRNFLFRLRHCAQLWRWTVEGLRYDRTRNGWHITVAITETVSPAFVVAAQAILGSDVKREAFNLMRVQRLAVGRLRGEKGREFWDRRWNVLYASHSRGVKVGA